MKSLVAMLVCLGALTNSRAAPGSVDLSFDPNRPTGPDGIVVSLAVQNDGKVVISGLFTYVDGELRPHLARLLPNGSLDPTFALDNLGFPSSGPNNIVYATAMQPDQKILIGGWFTAVHSVPRSRIARLDAKGTLDTTFGTTTSGPNNNVFAMALQPDGRIIIGGQFTAVTGTARPRIARLSSTGALDTSFNPFNGPNDVVYSVALQSNGKVVLGGSFSEVDATPRNRVARLNTNGSLDLTFSADVNGPGVYSVAVQPDGKVFIAGDFTSVNGTNRSHFARLNTNGTLDTTFGQGQAGANSYIYASVIQSDGKILIAGDFTMVNGTNRGGIARLNPDGTLDATFGKNLAGADSAAWTVATNTGNHILIGGDFLNVHNVARTRVARLLHTGSAAIALSVQWTNGNAALSWPDPSFVLQSAPAVAGPYTTLTNALNPYLLQPAPSPRFFRLKEN